VGVINHLTLVQFNENMQKNGFKVIALGVDK